jgi:CRP/FNR family cyclic AMP-dependent transcriptional regulator
MATSNAAPDDILNSAQLSDSLRALAQRGVLRRVAKNMLLIQEGDVGDTLYIIVEGRLRAFTSTPEDDRQFFYGTYGPGDYVGEMGLDGGRRSASVMALEPTLCAVVTRPTLEHYIAENPAFAFELLGRVIARARSATEQAQMMALKNVYGRLRWLLSSQAIVQPDGQRLVSPRPTHLEIASRIGCGREMVSRVMKDLERGDFIRTVPQGLLILRELPADW